MIGIIDYGLGNILAFANVYKRLHVPVAVVRTAAQVREATKLILPGVGAFDHAMELLNASGMREALDEVVLSNQVPLLGVCVGMQILGKSSDEGRLSGLSWIDGVVKKIDTTTSGQPVRLPHMGWNDVRPERESSLFAGLQTDARFYFLHSYYFQCAQPQNVLATSDYPGNFACAVQAGSIYGVQFHPEKSHRFGVRLLQNFAEL
ncbi:imidazole glycerol phosphate synthase subunit HisH [Peristeroidobacter soli]|jgi:glutamine amidotransferase|uniref:imidazole glycerol phosphate synthase subunit HisH n=1 Tax=Peristeroidobacter soli TaxID=2497877 RepID=UPI00101D6DA8|nr:imidazole glycerol phosphate synthase subunit HisH [Peristeroidobacter soli]